MGISAKTFITPRRYFSSVIGDTNLVLRHNSALECLEYFNGYLNNPKIEVYSLENKKIDNENIKSEYVSSYDNIAVVKVGNLRCTSFNQTINDMLSDEENRDEQALMEALAQYYGEHKETFDGLEIDEKNKELFENKIKNWAIECYYED